MLLSLTNLERQSKKLTKTWPMDLMFEGNLYCHLETVIHEAAHAASLGVPFDASTVKAVGNAIHKLEDDDSDRFLKRHSEAVLDEEAKAWAIEWEVIKRLNLDDLYDWQLAVSSARDQGVEEDRLHKYLDTPETMARADQVMLWLQELEEKTK